MQVRNATLADVPAIVAMSAKFYPTTHYATWTDMDAESVAEQATALVNSHIFLLSEDEQGITGMLGAYVLPFMFNKHAPCAYEVVWWVSPDARGARCGRTLLRSLDEPARDIGARRIVMAHMPNSPPEAAALLRSEGYMESEIQFTKDL